MQQMTSKISLKRSYLLPIQIAMSLLNTIKSQTRRNITIDINHLK